ncbi:MAG: hypothetical protein AAFO95_17800, partial [Cyanobacteria bacterium J06600_6]
INFDDRCGGFYSYQAYLLAAEYIKAFPDSRFADEIVEQLQEWSHGNFWYSKIDLSQIIAKEAKKVLEKTDRTRAIATVEKQLQSAKQRDLLLSTVKQLLELDPNNQIAIATIQEELESSNDNNELSYLVGLCDEYKIIEDRAIKILIELLKQIKPDDMPEAHAWVGNTFYYLNRMVTSDENVIDALIHFVTRIYPKGYIFLVELALETLGVIARNNRKAIAFLESFIQKYSSGTICSLSTRALWTIEPNNFLAIETAIKLLDDEQELLAAREVAYSLLVDEQTYLNLSPEYLEKVIAYLINRLVKDYEFQQAHREHAELVGMGGCDINILGKTATTNKAALEGLYLLLSKVEDWHSKMYIYSALPHREAISDRALNIIYKFLESVEDNWQKYNIARKIIEKDDCNKVALEIYNSSLNIIDDKYTRLEIAKKLALANPRNKLAIKVLSESIYISGSRSRYCLSESELALSVLEKIDPSKKLAIQALEACVKKTADQDALIYALKHLKRLDPENNIAQQRINKIVASLVKSMENYEPDDDNYWLNMGVYWRVIMSSQILPEVIRVLKPYLKDQSSSGLNVDNIACAIIWDCAQQMSYQDFHQAWHLQTSS